MKKAAAILLCLCFLFSAALAEHEYDFMIILDTSGSMRGTPISVMQQAVDNLMRDLENQHPYSAISMMEYNTDAQLLQDFQPISSVRSRLNSRVYSLYANGNTQMNKALKLAKTTTQKHLMYNADNRVCVVFMSDGYPEGCTIDSVFTAADQLHALKNVDVYSVGFFHSMTGSERKSCEDVMRYIASDHTKFFVVDNANDFGLVFADIYDIILEADKIVIWVDCPVDVSLTYNGETLDKYNKRTSFGSLQFEGANNERKVLRLNPGVDYTLTLTGTGTGYMDYTIWYPAQGNEERDTRKIVGIPVTREMRATTTTVQTYNTVISLQDGSTYSAAAGQKSVYNQHQDPISSFRGEFAATASSYYENNATSVAPSQVLDGKASTSWDAWGEYEGAWLQLSVMDGYEYLFNGFTIRNGKGTTTQNQPYYKKNSRVKDVSVYIDGNYVGTYTLMDTAQEQSITFDEPVSGSRIRFEVDTVYQGSEYTNKNFGVCIAEIKLW